MLLTIALTIGLVAVAMLGLSIGLILTGRCIKGSCGGDTRHGADGQPQQCPTCPNRKKHAARKTDAPASI